MQTTEKHIEGILSQLPKSVGENDKDTLFFPLPSSEISYMSRNLPPPPVKLLCFKWDYKKQEWYFVE